ncbi:unnamed protein product [Angiostrongylus costaricensis]|uniref:IRK_C domain-containing protein n=1 Tax=Angiostrongylus costaricensis TaxID=334426 RepID=A0A0R3PPR1_ANGCS|nr:unnamed protein product [Angiostrongylus costaricensis]
MAAVGPLDEHDRRPALMIRLADIQKKLPIIARHVIDESSPLHGLTKESLLSAEVELIMTVECIVEPTGMTFQTGTSFLPNETLWGHK